MSLARYALMRAALVVPLLAAASLLSFVLIQMSPGDPAEVALRLNDITPTPDGRSGTAFSRKGDGLRGLPRHIASRSHIFRRIKTALVSLCASRRKRNFQCGIIEKVFFGFCQ